MSDEILARIAAALERLSPPPPTAPDFSTARAFHWRPRAGGLTPLPHAKALPLDLILSVDHQKDALLANTRQFAAGHPANNALLWGARGTGKSALIKAVHAHVAAEVPALKIVEAAAEDLAHLGDLLALLATAPVRAILFLDDLSFEGDEAALKALKPALDGGLAGRGANVAVYATSNRRHLAARDVAENAQTIHARDTVEDRLALSDRFGLWLGFHSLDQPQYLEIVDAYAARLSGPVDAAALHREALLWAHNRAARSGRTAFQFITDFAGRMGLRLTL
jgi:hypothetical protein